MLQDIEGVPKIEEGINPATYALQVPTACCSRRAEIRAVSAVCTRQPSGCRCATSCVHWQVTNRSKERDLDKDFADVYEQSDLHKCAVHPVGPAAVLCSLRAVLLMTCYKPCSASGHEQATLTNVAAPFDPHIPSNALEDSLDKHAGKPCRWWRTCQSPRRARSPSTLTACTPRDCSRSSRSCCGATTTCTGGES